MREDQVGDPEGRPGDLLERGPLQDCVPKSNSSYLLSPEPRWVGRGSGLREGGRIPRRGALVSGPITNLDGLSEL